MLTSGSVADCPCAGERVESLSAGHLIAGKGHDSDKIVEQAHRQRHLVENACVRIRQWGRIATRYARRLAFFAAAVNFRCLFLWLDVL